MGRTRRHHGRDAVAMDARRRQLRRRRRADRRRRRRAEEAAGWQGVGSCGRKVRFASRANAEEFAVAASLMWPGSRPQVAYECELCGGWHLTTHPWRAASGGAAAREGGSPRGTGATGDHMRADRGRLGGGVDG